VGKSLDRDQASGMTVNERLFAAGLLGAFDAAVKAHDVARLRGLLSQVYLSHDEIEPILDEVLAPYPKVSAIVVSRQGGDFTAETETGETVRVSVANRSGRGHHEDIQPGLRIKLYRRPGEDYWRFRFIGS
jgi:hypothetical protein